MLYIGNFEAIKNKLIDLSSGDWVRKSVATPVSLEHMNFKVRLFQASYASNGRILWQVDVGYDEGVNMASQIVRGQYLPPSIPSSSGPE